MNMRTLSAYLLGMSSFSLFVLSSSCVAISPDAPIVLKGEGGVCSPSREICGDGIDEDCDGDDLPCATNDKDRDGYVTGNDCDDYDRRVYPGIAVRCSASCGAATQICQADGSLSPCSCSPLCEATGSGRCYYISRLSGKDSNDGSFASPWASQLNIVSYYAAADRPANWRALQPGDVVYFMAGLYDGTFRRSNDMHGLSFDSLQGTAANRIAIKTYPGASVALSPASAVNYNMTLSRSRHVLVEGFEIASVYNDGLLIVDSEQVELRNLRIRDVDGVDNNNLSGLKFKNATNVRLHHSLLHDNYDRTNADTGGTRTANSRNIVLFDGGNIRIDHNVFFQTPPITDSRKGGACVSYKHAATVSGSSYEIDHNIFWNCFDNSIGSGTFNSYIHHNIIYSSDPIGIGDFGGLTYNSNIRIENNTVINGGGLKYNASDQYGPIGPLTFKNNIVIDNIPSYNNNYGILRIDPYGSDSRYLLVSSPSNLIVSSNCYYNSSTAPKFNLYAYNGGASGTYGGLYSFAEWQALGYDAGSIVANPRLDASDVPAETQCANMGVWAGW